MSRSRPRVTAVITAHNAERYVSRAIDSALSQTFGPVHVIVVDDGSSDSTSDVVTAYDDGVKLIRLPENNGPAVGRTTGLMKCTTEFVAFLDSDDYWLPEFVQETVAFLDAHPSQDSDFLVFTLAVDASRPMTTPSSVAKTTPFYCIL